MTAVRAEPRSSRGYTRAGVALGRPVLHASLDAYCMVIASLVAMTPSRHDVMLKSDDPHRVVCRDPYVGHLDAVLCSHVLARGKRR